MSAGRSSGRVAGKVALVTGGASGLGEAIARRLASEGATVIVADLNEPAAPGAEFIRLDVTDEAQWTAAMAALASRHGRLDVAVNCAGTQVARSFPSETTLEDWRRVMSVNLDGVFLGTKHALALMRRGDPAGGSIVNISSMLGLVGMPDIAPYCASKGGVHLYTKSVALSCAEQRLKVRVNSVHPGFIDTPLLRKSMARFGDMERARTQLDAMQPLGHIGEPDDVAWGVLYLASDESKFVTGSALVIDGGYTAR
ncbi:MAG TPA: glucose 1-dehydrogenase [Burkholderiaceae bacterium]|nr:glucose 1-dehydrogenase [Burkholderiaceae bacterium]